jgi:organic hydroperoxide reductase OsmC/OhrA
MPIFTAITLQIDLTVDVSDEERARRLLEKAERSCIISNALSVPVSIEATVATERAAAAH